MKKIFNGEKFGLLTHHDLDGAGCAVLAKYVFGDQIKTVKSTGYHKIIQQAQKIDSENLLITDISLSQEQIDAMADIAQNVILIDHHETSLAQTYPEHWTVHINMKACGCKLTYLWLRALGYDYFPAETAEFVELVNDFDMWHLKHPESILLNNLFWERNFFGFVKDLASFNITEEMLQKGQAIQDVKEAEIADFDNFLIDGILRVVVADDHISDISLFYTEQDHFVIIRKKGSCSLRSKLDMMPFFERLNAMGVSGGGHKHAGGCELAGTEYEDDPTPVIELFYNWIMENQ
jgi:oligoribonuclease NrnB/cAMP/cGMP phosphodiesterase (DHH superfamily)